MERAQFVLSELRSGLAFLFDDGIIDDDDARLERLASAYDSAFSQDDVAAALDAYATFAEPNRKKLAGLGGFDPAVIDEAPTLARKLRDCSAEKLVSTTSGTERTALDLRNRLAALLWDRMPRVRAVTLRLPPTPRAHPQSSERVRAPKESAGEARESGSRREGGVRSVLPGRERRKPRARTAKPLGLDGREHTVKLTLTRASSRLTPSLRRYVATSRSRS